ncbi:ATP-binding protein [Streptomyces xylophagus]|uniref:ATP-binding protein n=1 Tax=Streptomyces xylophagus TaxID=285514 RepID=UPI000B056E97|nr:ATP-binding protein [Streptomyces xylophagus]
MHQQKIHSLGLLGKVASPEGFGSDEALQGLRDFGLSDPNPPLRKALQVALTHTSYVYENDSLFPAAIRGVFSPLQELGKSYLRKQVAVEIFRRESIPNVGFLSGEVAQVSSSLQRWVPQQAWILSSCSIGRSLSRNSLPWRVVADFFYQVVGVLCLAGEDETAASLVSDVLAYSDQSAGIRDPKTLLQEQIKQPLTYEYRRSGPDHAAAFQATVTSQDGRQGMGEGPNKKAASRGAAEEFLRKYVPKVSRKEPDPELGTNAVEIPEELPHGRMVGRLQDLFSLSPAARPLLSQALIHSSWAYENRPKMKECRQRDNLILGYIGSQVLNYEFSLSCARQAAEYPLQELLSLSSPPNRVLDKAFRYAGLAQGLLLGAGQASLGIPQELGANTFQAVIGAVFVSKSFPAAMRPEWPIEWEPIWRMVVQESQDADPSTLLAQIASAMKLHFDLDFVASGPDHARKYKAVAVLGSQELGVQTKVPGADVAGKTHARQVVSQIILDVIAHLASEHPKQSLAKSKGALSLARFVLTHQAAIISEQHIPVQRWVDSKLFGLHWASSPRKLLEWSQDADDLVTRVVDFRPSASRFEQAFRAANEAISDSVDDIESELTATLDVLESVDNAESISRDQLDVLVQLCNVYRCLGSRDPDISVGELAADWQLLHRGRLEIPQALPLVRVTGRERAILDAAMNSVMTSRSKVVVEVASSQPLRLDFATTHPLDRATLEHTCSLWSRVSRTVKVEATENGIQATVVGATVPDSPGPITRAALAAMEPIAHPYQAAVADLLHDLKNQLVAARLATSSPADTRTARLEQQLAASRHLDQAQALAVRLRATTSLLKPVDAENTELGSFLRSYASTMLSRLPRHISLSVPDARQTVRVALSERGLIAVLDNLVGNSIEALSEGGAIMLDWTSDDNEAVIEVADDGPGLPGQVIEALSSGERVRSTKPGGNGLGLLGVRSLLGRVGGELTLVPSNSGTAWLITLPLSSDLTQEGS